MKPAALLVLHFVLGACGYQNDWLNIEYLIKYSANSSHTKASTQDAQNTVVRLAQNTAEEGPWSIKNSETLPPSNDPHDYLSWAPYHWPNCNWCEDDSSFDSGIGPNNLVSPSNLDQSNLPSHLPSYPPRGLGRLFRRAALYNHDAIEATASPELPISAPDTPIPLPTDPPGPDTTAPTPASGDEGGSSSTTPATDAPYQKTSASHSKPTKTSKASCTHSPTTSMAPSSTWTTCPYVVRDGVVNPDVRTLRGPGAIVRASEAFLFNAIAYGLTRSSQFAQNCARLINFFFLDPETKMNPNMNYGQIVRGPGAKGRQGTFTGILDLRGVMNIVNGDFMLRAFNPAETTSRYKETADGLRAWMSDYLTWLGESEIGKVAESRPNNHGTFYTSQIAAIHILLGNTKAAIDALNKFFQTTFRDQIASSGEQPFEAVRTRPYHYACFNLEALFAIAKLGDQLGLNFWTAKTKYGATIQTAIDHVVNADPKGENPGDCVPQVAAAAAVFGDSDGKYAAYLNKYATDYKRAVFWFYDQPEAISQRQGKRQARSGEEIPENSEFECPSAFARVDRVEIEDGIFVTCELLRPYYSM